MDLAKRLVAAARAEGRTALDEVSSKRILVDAGIAVPRGVVGADPAAAARAAATAGLTFPLVAKLVSPDAVHKSDLGGVRLGLSDAAALLEALEALARLARERGLGLDGLLVEETAPAGCEMVIGGVVDPRFGPVIMAGLGGIFVELFEDVAFRVCPVAPADAKDMLEELRAVALLRGARGGPRLDEAAVVAALLAVGGAGGLMERLGASIRSLDVNPLIVAPRGAVACDARIVPA
ncbi:MAG: acetyl-CoA synthetase [Alphaproteobacteria bacterium]|nr:acetyl-CoA synthetase [Alphaproteobacteria bacterium]